MTDKCVILCADHLCIHNSGSGYYGVCIDPELTTTGYCGIDRVYRNTCLRRQTPPVIKDDGEKTESGLLEEE